MSFVQWLTPGRHQVIEPPDDAGWMTVRIQTETPELAKMLVFGLGTQAMIVEPQELRAAVLDTANNLVESYAQRASNN